MSKYSYLATEQEVANTFLPNPLCDYEGYMCAWRSNPEVLQKLLPPPLQLDGDIVKLYTGYFHSPTLIKPYREVNLMIRCKYKDRPGYHSVSMMVEGPGAEMGAYLGRERSNMPKKFPEAFTVERTGNTGSSVVTRGGVELFNLKADINGQYNNPEVASAFFAGHEAGNRVFNNHFFFRYETGIENGKPCYTGGYMQEVDIHLDMKKWEPATIDVVLGETADDPWAEIEVLEPIGGAYMLLDLYTNGRTVLGPVDTQEGIRRVIKHRFDARTYGGEK